MITNNKEQQLKWAKTIVQKWLDANVGRGAELKYPLTYREIWDLIKSETEELGLSSSNMMGGDAYMGARSRKNTAKEDSGNITKADLNKMVEKLQTNKDSGGGGKGRSRKPANTRKPRGRRGKGKGKSKYGSAPLSAEARAKETCESFNAGACSLSSCKKGAHR